ncbi:hypothetical protein HPB48_007302 [Haemaphysalis longicornis]|uniref:Uncharacterized protein n=1 Tax=Haemaphysalis longicornis TaxID=44386 RepID=A0A9J6GL32_HAELO|nr:hypothetical protein HPB48_007302 [Haemaphysalis longicornis]
MAYTEGVYWRILDPSTSKTESQACLNLFAHNITGDDHTWPQILTDTYISPPEPQAPLVTYSGTPNPQLDTAFTFAELLSALHTLTRTTAAGPD